MKFKTLPAVFLVVALVTASVPASAQGASKASYELQERCKKSAAELVAHEYASQFGYTDEKVSFENHYNADLNGCFAVASVQIGGVKSATISHNRMGIVGRERE